MASGANVFRKAMVDMLRAQTSTTAKACGLVLKCYRDYEAAPRKPSMTQKQLARLAKVAQPVVSRLETGKSIPQNAELKRLLAQVGLRPTKSDPGARALYRLLRAVRDVEDDLGELKAP